MSQLNAIFADLRARNTKALMPFVCGGFPSSDTLACLLPALHRAGASVVEVGYPFSDPIADGPVIAAAMHEALLRGANPENVNGSIVRARTSMDTGGAATARQLGIVAMVSVSIVHRTGAAKFIADAKAAGVDGFIFPDVPLEESADLLARSRDAGLSTSLLIAPTTPPARAAAIARACTGFVYVLARAGITGETDKSVAIEPIARRVAELRRETDVPLAVGFGVSSASDVRAIVRDAGADAAIVGSALVRRMADAHASGADPVAAAESFTRELAAGVA